MSGKKLHDNYRFSTSLFLRTLKSDKSIYYVRFIDRDTHKVISQRSTGTDDRQQAIFIAGKLHSSLDLNKIASQKADRTAGIIISDNIIIDWSFSRFLDWFWDEKESKYILDRIDADKGLNSEYIRTQRKYLSDYALSYRPFKETRVPLVTVSLIEDFKDWLKEKRNLGNNVNKIVRVVTALRTPLSWAIKRGLIQEPFKFCAIILPKTQNSKRGILTTDEVKALVHLPSVSHVVSRPRLKAGRHHENPAPLDTRMKAIVFLSEFAALRRSEIRALRWRNVNFDDKTIFVEIRYSDKDGFKVPKRTSKGMVPMAIELDAVLKQLYEQARLVDRNHPEDFVIMNCDRDVPVADITLTRAHNRALAHLGIENDKTAKKEGRPPKINSKQSRHLSLHSGRHGAATRLAMKLPNQVAAKITRHKDVRAFQIYSDHTTKETLDAGRRALSVADVSVEETDQV